MNSARDYSTRTFGNEDLLPRVPLPDLESSCERFLAWCAPLLTQTQLAQTRAAVADFLAPDSPARVLQAALERYDAEPGVHSWLDTFWPYRYLGRRDRIAINANFFFLFRGAPPGAAEPQAARAAQLVAAAVDFKLRLDEERIPPAFQRGQPLSMEQNKSLFSATRIPGVEQDTVRVPYTPQRPGPSPARHIVVFTAGRMVRLDVVAPDGRPYPEHEIAAALRAVREMPAPRPAEPVGHLTTMARAEWARWRQTLLEHPANADALETVESALLCLCLDDVTPVDPLQACDQLLHGDSGNRWFDKALSFVVFADGRAGINIEHCGLDGTTILSFVDDILDPSTAESPGPFAVGTPAFEPVEFVLDDGTRAAVRTAAADFAAYAADTATTLVSFEDFGADRAKQLGMSPDAFVQLAYQLAHQRAKGHLGATYESIATRQWRRGRTEAMRVITPEILAFVAAMEAPAAAEDPAAARRDAFRSAAQAHVARAKDCQQGRAPEQHLWELQLIQRRRGAELGATEPLALYESPGWLVMRDDYLSTSSAPSTNIEYFGFGSTSSHCIGIAYVLLPDRLNIYLSTPRQVEHQMTGFADELRRAISELVELLAAEHVPG